MNPEFSSSHEYYKTIDTNQIEVCILQYSEVLPAPKRGYMQKFIIERQHSDKYPNIRFSEYEAVSYSDKKDDRKRFILEHHPPHKKRWVKIRFQPRQTKNGLRTVSTLVEEWL